jgi:hypothetical protein
VSKFRSASILGIASIALATLGGCAVVPGVHVFPPRLVVSGPQVVFPAGPAVIYAPPPPVYYAPAYRYGYGGGYGGGYGYGGGHRHGGYR